MKRGSDFANRIGTGSPPSPGKHFCWNDIAQHTGKKSLISRQHRKAVSRRAIESVVQALERYFWLEFRTERFKTCYRYV